VGVKTLLVLRHAKSSWDDPSLDDHERPLNGRGRKDAPRVGGVLKQRGLTPDLVVSSDAVRAHTTAHAAAREAGYRGEIVSDKRLYLASPTGILAVLRGVRPVEAETVMVVGHNPGLEELVAHLAGTPEPMPTAALAQIDLPIDDWRELTTSTRGTLVDVWRPKEAR
jgi:phosphohistidine phosphatase